MLPLMDQWQPTRKTSGLQLGASTTGPLRAPAARPDTPAATGGPRLEDEARRLLALIEERMELLWRACDQAACPVPGVADLPLRHPVSPAGERFVGYLAERLAPGSDLARAVPVALYRYREIGDAVSHFSDAAVGLPPGLPPREPLGEEKLRRGLFYLGNLHAEFKQDPALARLFPPPRTVDYVIPDAPKPLPGGSADERLRVRKAAEEAVRKAQDLVRWLAPRLAAIRAAIDRARTAVVSTPGDLFTPEGRQATRLVLELAAYPALIPPLEAAIAQHQRLEALLPTGPLPPGFDPEPLRELALPLGQLPVMFRNNKLLATYFLPPPPVPVRAVAKTPSQDTPMPVKPQGRPAAPAAPPRTRPPMSPV